jgi:hypothetical protein
MSLSLLFSASSLALCAFSFIFFLAYLRRRTGAERILADFREEVDKLIAEIDGATDRDAALVEERIKTLRGLLDDADRRISVYVRELERRRAQEKAYADLGKSPIRYTEAAQASAVSAGLPAEGPLFTVSSESPPLSGRGQEEASASPPDAPLFPRAARRSLSLGLEVKPLPLPERVAELYRAGNSVPQIAERLGVTLAEVDLAVALLQGKSR